MRCTNTTCGHSFTPTRAGSTRRHELDAFIAWITSPATQRDTRYASARTFRRATAWCWSLDATLTPAGVVHDHVELDGIYIADLCLLIAYADGHVLATQWCDTEKAIAWRLLLRQVPPPTVAIIDGGSGLASALKQEWPETRIQRCLVHVQRNIRRHLTRRPRTDTGKELAKLSRTLTRITTTNDAATWLAALHAFGQTHHTMLNEKTYPHGPSGPWGWTHERLRKAYRLLELLAKRGHLFTYLDPDLPAGCPSTTNRIEGGINAQLRDLAKHHRGMPAAHLHLAADLWIYLHAEGQHPIRALIPDAITTTKTTASTPEHDEPTGPVTYDTAYSPEDGNGIRHGWAGRSHRP